MKSSAGTWQKSSRSTSTGGECVEVGSLHEVVVIRDSKDPSGPKLALGKGAFGAFLEWVKGR
jgi:hypothetical protein